MSQKHQTMLRKIFAHPIATNLDWKKLAATLEHFGAQIDTTTANRARIRLNGAEMVLSLPHHGHEITNKSDVTNLKHFLEEAGVTP